MFVPAGLEPNLEYPVLESITTLKKVPKLETAPAISII